MALFPFAPTAAHPYFRPPAEFGLARHLVNIASISLPHVAAFLFPSQLHAHSQARRTGPVSLVQCEEYPQTSPQRFMQPESPTIPTEELHPEPSSATTTPAQYGRHDHDATAHRLPADDASQPDAVEEQVSADATIAAELAERRNASPERATSRLSSQNSDSPAPPAGRNRVTEYENASTPPVRKRRGPGIEVISTRRNIGDKRSPIQELPNGTIYFLAWMGSNKELIA